MVTMVTLRPRQYYNEFLFAFNHTDLMSIIPSSETVIGMVFIIPYHCTLFHYSLSLVEVSYMVTMVTLRPIKLYDLYKQIGLIGISILVT